MKNLKQELNEMKFLFGYRPGKVLSEQNLPTEAGYDMYEGLGMETDMYEMDDDIVMVEPDVMEPEVKPDTDRDVEEKPYRPGRPDRDPSRLPYPDPDTHPQGRGKHYDRESEPFSGGERGFESDSKLEDLVMKYLNNRR
jgi:hypothetical protein